MRITKSNQEKNKRKALKMNLKKKIQGITLIALVVTVIVLLILAGVAINLTIGDNGMFKRAQNAADTYQEASEREAIELAVAGMQIGSTQGNDMTKTELENSLEDQFGDDASVEDNEDGSFLVTIGENQYYLGENGEIIDSSNMVKISTADELKAFRDDVNSGNTYEGKYVYLANDITLDINEEWEPIGLYLNENTSPDDETNIPFSGIFDGKGHEVDGIYINTPNKVQGLFGLINNGKILNLGIGENCNINGGNATAGVLGYAYNNSVINNCSNKANINGLYVGGVVGCAYVSTKIMDCYNEGNIQGTNSFAGGVAGYVAQDSSIKESYNLGEVNGIDHVGGVVGNLILNSIMESCHNNGNINGGYMAGGIVGFSGEKSNLTQNYNTGNVNGEYYVGGVSGVSYAIVEQCYNTGYIEASGQNESGNSNVGGIIGLNEGTAEECYNTGTVRTVYENIGGLIGLNRGTLKNSYNAGIIEGEVIVKGGIVGYNNKFSQDRVLEGKVYNTYSLEGVTMKLYGVNDSTISKECSFKSSSELKEMHSILGNAFENDKNNENNGYPIFKWQI